MCNNSLIIGLQSMYKFFIVAWWQFKNIFAIQNKERTNILAYNRSLLVTFTMQLLFIKAFSDNL